MAKKLAEDLDAYARGIDFVIVTDRQEDFQTYANVKTYPYKQKSRVIVFDKLIALEKALELFDSAIFIDADSRIYDTLRQPLEFQPGLTALSCCGLKSEMLRRRKNKMARPLPAKIASLPFFSPIKIWRFLKLKYRLNDELNKIKKKAKVLQRLSNEIDVNYQKVKYVHEILFALTKAENKTEKSFFRFYYQISEYLQDHGFLSGQGYSMGFAAAKSGLPVTYRGNTFYPEFPYFKDRILSAKKAKGQKPDDNELKLLRFRKAVGN